MRVFYVRVFYLAQSTKHDHMFQSKVARWRWATLALVQHRERQRQRARRAMADRGQRPLFLLFVAHLQSPIRRPGGYGSELNYFLFFIVKPVGVRDISNSTEKQACGEIVTHFPGPTAFPE